MLPLLQEVRIIRKQVRTLDIFIVVFIMCRYLSMLRITFGGMCMLAQSRGGAFFCTRGGIQRYDVDLFIVALAKTVTQVGVPGGIRGRPHRSMFFARWL
jgi:hypothetical protein